jgi:MoaA/NifB/PqqE/SkfB family radical SAM enzyme
MLFKKLQLLRGLINGEMAYTGPIYINVDITRRCNMACQGCQYHSSETRKDLHKKKNTDYISINLIDKLCEDFKNLNIREVFLLGPGEPLFHPHINKIISVFKQAGCKVQLFTNGTLINEGMAQMLVKSGLDVLRVSLWGINREEYEKCYPGVKPENLEKTFQGIREVNRIKNKHKLKNPYIILTTPLNRHNWMSIKERIHLAKDLGCDSVMFDIYRDWGEFESNALSKDEIVILSQKLSEARTELKNLCMDSNIHEILLRYRLGKEAWRKLPCYAGWFHTRLNVDGNIIPCGSCTRSLGSLKENSLTQIWNGPEYRSFRRKMLNPQGTSAFNNDCYCDWCCLGKSNYKVYQFYKWIDPIVRKFNIRNNDKSESS